MSIDKKNNKGVTLIALVVTVIVLIILSGVSVSVLTGDNGLINKAREERTEVNETVDNTQSNLNELYVLRQNIL